MNEEERQKVRAEIKHRIATNLVRIREERGLTQEELDEKCGFNPGYTKSVEDQTINVILYAIERMADALNCTAVDLVQRLQM